MKIQNSKKLDVTYRPNVWYQQGTHGTLIPIVAEAKRAIARLYHKKGKDLFITSQNDSDHLMHSFHYLDRAFDWLPNGVSLKEVEKELSNAFPGSKTNSDFDLVDNSTYFHLEYDPK